MRRILLRGSAAGLAMGWLMLNLPLPAAAQTPPGTPLLRTSHRFPHGYMEYTVDAGKSVQDTVTIEDAGPGAATFALFAADGLTSVVSGIVYADRDHPLRDGPSGNGEYGAGSWITLSTSSVQLAQDQKVTVNLSVAVPAQAGPGDYVGAVSAENPTPSRGAGQFGLNVTTRTTIAVVVHVPGPVVTAAVSIGTPFVTVENKTRQILNVPLVYRGDVLVKPYVDLRVLDGGGRELLHIARQLDTFVPHTEIDFPFPLDQSVLPPGQYRLVANFGPQGSEQSFDLPFGVTVAEAQVPPPSQRGPHVSGTGTILDLPRWLLPLLIVPIALIPVPLWLMWRAWRRRSCAHCGRTWRGRPVAVSAAGNVATCARCRSGLMRGGTRVRLCPECIAGHRGWQRTG